MFPSASILSLTGRVSHSSLCHWRAASFLLEITCNSRERSRGEDLPRTKQSPKCLALEQPCECCSHPDVCAVHAHVSTGTLLHLHSLTAVVHAIITPACIIGNALCKWPVIEVIGHWLTQLLVGNLCCAGAFLNKSSTFRQFWKAVSTSKTWVRRNLSRFIWLTKSVTHTQKLLAQHTDCNTSFSV